MSARDLARPRSYSWIARVYTKNDHGGDELAGCGVVIDDTRVLTCAHVVGRFDAASGWAGDAEVRVAFPKNDEGGPDELLPVQGMVFPDSGEREDDLAVLYLSGPLPARVKPAPLRCPDSGSLASGRWRVLGFPDDPVGESASGTAEELARGWIRLNKESGDPLRLGFSGSGVWSAEYQAVVAVVTQAGAGDGRAITLRRADACLPGENLGDLTRWSLAHDREAGGHWELRARGVSTGSDRRSRFQGRKAALLKIKKWLDRDQASRRVLVVTGAPGAGKSAVLARIVTTADPDRSRELHTLGGEIWATAGSVGCAVHARGKTALEVATEIARAASAELPEQVEKFAEALRDALEARRVSGQPPRRFSIIIDAVDEADSPEQAREVISEVIMPVSRTCADAGAQVIVGLRSTDVEGSLLRVFGSAAELIDLDDEEFFAREDLAAYALATLQLAERGRDDNPYADESIARPVADRIAELSDRNFLVAGLTAQAHGLFDTVPVDPAALSFSPEVKSVMDEYLRRIPGIVGIPRPDEVLRTLAFAEAPGFPVGLWRQAIQALYGEDVPEMRLEDFAKSRAARFLVESSDEDGQGSVFSLFHHALNDALLAAVDPGTARRAGQALTHAFLQAGRDGGWDQAPAYLMRSLPAHAARAALVDDVLADDGYLLHADLRRVVQVAGQAVSPSARSRARLLGLTLEAIAGKPAERAALFSVTESLNGLGTAYREVPWKFAYRARWATVPPSHENLALRGHAGQVLRLSVAEVGHRVLLASGGSDGTVRLWNLADSSLVRVLKVHWRWVVAVCGIEAEGRTLLAVAGSEDGTVQLWDPADGSLVRTLQGHRGAVYAVCGIEAEGQILLATSGKDGTVRLWDPADGSLVQVIEGQRVFLQFGNSVGTMCAVEVGGRTLLATGGNEDGTVWLRDPADGSQIELLQGSIGERNPVCAVEVDGQTLLAIGGHDGTVQLWDPAGSGSLVRTLRKDWSAVRALCLVEVEGRTLLAAGRSNGTVQLWDPANGSLVRALHVSRDSVDAVRAVEFGGQIMLAVAGSGDGTVRLWDPCADLPDGGMQAPRRRVNAVCPVEARGQTLLAVAGFEQIPIVNGPGDRTVQLRNAADGSVVRTLQHEEWVRALCTVEVRGRTLLATGDTAGTVRLWDPANGSAVRVLEGHRKEVMALCTVRVRGRTLLASSSADGTVRLWNPVRGSTVRIMHGDQYGAGMYAVCAVSIGDRTLVASGEGGRDTKMWLWDPADGSVVRVLTGHQGAVVGACAVQAEGRTLLASSCTMDVAVRLLDPADGSLARVLQGHQGGVNVVRAAKIRDRTLLVTGSPDGTIRLWDPSDGRCVRTIPVHYPVSTVASMADSLAIGLDAGILVIEFNVDSIE